MEYYTKESKKVYCSDQEYDKYSAEKSLQDKGTNDSDIYKVDTKSTYSFNEMIQKYSKPNVESKTNQ